MIREERHPDSGGLLDVVRDRADRGQSPAEIIAALLRLYGEDPPRSCRVCGCTDNDACLPPCWWVELDLCSSPSCVRSDTLRQAARAPRGTETLVAP